MAAAAKPATRRKTKTSKPFARRAGKSAAKRSHASAMMTVRKGTVVIPVKTGAAKTGIARKTDPANPLGIKLPTMPFNYSHDSVMNVLVGMLILFAVVSAGIFYPQTTTTERALTAAAPGMMLKK